MGTSQCKGNIYKKLKTVSDEQRFTGHGWWISDELQRLRTGVEKSVIGLRYMIHSLMTILKKALDKDEFQDIKGTGQKTLDTMRRYVSEHA